jgi:hypothetical protein
MAVVAGRDYAFIRKCTVIFDKGLGDGTTVFTPARLVSLPIAFTTYSPDKKQGEKDGPTTSDLKIDGKPPQDAVLELLENPETTPEILDTKLSEWATAKRGAMVRDMSEFPRMRIYTGFLRRGVALAETEKGLAIGKAISFRPRKDELPALLELFKDSPALEVKGGI